MSEYIARVQSPTLGDVNFASQLSDAFDTINDNFRKIVSAPYLEGQEGWSVVPIDMYLVDPVLGDLTPFGAAAARTIFGDDSLTSIQQIDYLFPSVGNQEHTASEGMTSNDKITVLAKYNPDTGTVEDYICCAEYYCYIDMRVKDLDSMSQSTTQESFTDYTCQIFGRYDGSTHEWSFEKSVMLPTIYFDQVQQCFCWKLNSYETGIRAQGIKGDDGRPPVAAVVRGIGSMMEEGDSSVVYINVSEYSYMTRTVVEGEVVTETGWAPIYQSNIQDGDMVCCRFNSTDAGTNIPYPDMVIANVSVTGEGTDRIYSIIVPDENRFSTLWTSYILFHAFKDIDYKSTDGNKTKAVFIPAYSDGVTHAIFQDDSGVSYTQESDGWTSEDNLREDDLVFKKVSVSRLVGAGSLGNQNKMTSYDSDQNVSRTTSARFEGYSLKASVNGLGNILLGVPVGTIVSWVNANSVPEGWALTGVVDYYVQPVFGLVKVTSGSYGLMVYGRDNTRLGMYQFRTIDSEGNITSTVDDRYKNIFCAVTGYVPENDGSIVVRDNQWETVDEFLEHLKTTEWNKFDMSYDSSHNAKLYLTKYQS